MLNQRRRFKIEKSNDSEWEDSLSQQRLQRNKEADLDYT